MTSPSPTKVQNSDEGEFRVKAGRKQKQQQQQQVLSNQKNTDQKQWQNPVYLTMFFKTETCKKFSTRQTCEYTTCPYYHGKKERRRAFGDHLYSSQACEYAKEGENWKEVVNCPMKDDCPKCHTRMEQQFHPEVYKKMMCRDFLSNPPCPRGLYCAFAHLTSELQGKRYPDWSFDWEKILPLGIQPNYSYTRTSEKKEKKVHSITDSLPAILTRSISASNISNGNLKSQQPTFVETKIQMCSLPSSTTAAPKVVTPEKQQHLAWPSTKVVYVTGPSKDNVQKMTFAQALAKTSRIDVEPPDENHAEQDKKEETNKEEEIEEIGDCVEVEEISEPVNEEMKVRSESDKNSSSSTSYVTSSSECNSVDALMTMEKNVPNEETKNHEEPDFVKFDHPEPTVSVSALKAWESHDSENGDVNLDIPPRDYFDINFYAYELPSGPPPGFEGVHPLGGPKQPSSPGTDPDEIEWPTLEEYEYRFRVARNDFSSVIAWSSAYLSSAKRYSQNNWLDGMK